MNLFEAIEAASGRGSGITFRHPDGTEDEESVANLLVSASRGAIELQRSGVAAGDVVALVGPAGLDLVTAWLAVLRVGAVPTLMAPPNQRQNAALWVAGMRHLASYTEASLVIVDGGVRPVIDAALGTADAAPRLLDLANLLSTERTATTAPPLRLRPDEVVLLQHSSGTTGLHKGVALTCHALLTLVELYAEALQLDPSRDRIASWLPVYHDMGLIACLVLPLVTGTDIILVDNVEWARQPGLLLDAIARHRCTLCWLPNFAFHHLTSVAADEAWDLASVRLWTNCSEPVKQHSFDGFVERFRTCGVTEAALGSSYALAENTFAATQSIPGKAPRSRALPGDCRTTVTSSGHPLGRHEIEIRGADGKLMPEGEIGEIWLRTPCLMSGYFRRNAEALQDGWYGTGDLGLLDAGELFVCGRARDMAIVAGKNVFPKDVESILGQLDGLHPGRCVTFGVDDDDRGTQRLVALAEHSADTEPDSKGRRALVRLARNRVAEEIGARLDELLIVGPGTLLKSSAGKLSRPRCRELYLSWREADGGRKSP